MYADDEKKPMCECCEEQPVARKIMMTSMDGLLIDQLTVCIDCASGMQITIRKDANSISY